MSTKELSELVETLLNRECDIRNFADIFDGADLEHDAKLNQLRNCIVRNLESAERLMTQFRRTVREMNGHDTLKNK